jgi:hypothetical protein
MMILLQSFESHSPCQISFLRDLEISPKLCLFALILIRVYEKRDAHAMVTNPVDPSAPELRAGVDRSPDDLE